MIGTKIGQYEIIEELGKGGMSTVYLARQTPMNRTIALKVLSPAMFQGKNLTDRFAREIRVISRLDHPHIETIYDFGESDGRYYIASQHLAGGNMANRLKENGVLPLDEVITPMRQIAGAIDYAHSQTIVHRNIKPENIRFDAAGNAYLSDFEIAYVPDDVITSEMIVGSPVYSAPEQLSAQKIDGRTDIYSFGVMVFELLTGTLPFQSDNMLEVMMMHTNQPVPSLKQRKSDLPEGIDEIFQQVMAKNPDDRYQTAIEFVSDLEKIWTAPPATKTNSNRRKIFISYRKLDKNVVHPIAALLKDSEHVTSVWIDMNLEGGQHWWNTILEEIRNADLVITALSDDYLDSIPCQREYRYALDLQKTLLPVRVGTLDYNRVARDLVQIQMVDFVENPNDRQQQLLQAIANAPVSLPLPDPLPEPPPIPLSILVEVEELANQSTITRDDEHKIFSHLFDILNGNQDAERKSALKILNKLQARRDISRGFYDKLQTLNTSSNQGGWFGFLRGRRKQ